MKLFVILVILKLYVQTQSQETGSLETRVVLIEIFVTLKFTERSKAPLMT